MTFRCKFLPGEIIQHKRYHYRGVIYDVDASCNADDEWYNSNKTQPKKDQPWYRVLVDGDFQTTYVAEENLQLDSKPEPIDHPMVQQIFSGFENGRYIRQWNA